MRKIQQTCLGKIGIPVGTFYKMDLGEVGAAMKGYIDAEEARSRSRWEQQRWSTWLLLNIQMERKHRFKDPYDLMPFPWEGVRKSQDYYDERKSLGIPMKEADPIFEKFAPKKI